MPFLKKILRTGELVIHHDLLCASSHFVLVGEYLLREVPDDAVLRLDEAAVLIRALKVPLAANGAVVLAKGLVVLDANPPTWKKILFY